MNQNELRQPDLFPHQVEFIETALKYAQGGRLLLEDEVGLGTNQAVAALIRAMSNQSETKLRTLLIAPKSVSDYWSDQLAQSGITGVVHVNPQEFRRLEARTEADQNPWASVETAVTSLDFVKNEERLQSLVSAGWDLVIFDEAHLASGPNQRGRLLQSLWESNQVRLMVAMTKTQNTLILFLQRSPDVILQPTVSDLIDWILSVAGKIEIAQIHLSGEERELLSTTIAMLESDPDWSPTTGFIQKNLLRRAASSLFAFAQSLEGLPYQDHSLDDFVSSISEGDESAGFEVDSAAQLPISRTQARCLLELIEQVSVDSKWNTCARLLLEGQQGTTSSAVIFTDFADTADYIANQLRETDPSLNVWCLSSESSFSECERAVASIRQEGGVLAVTSTRSASLDLSFVNLCLHYDVPPNARLLAQRLGRVNLITRVLPLRQIAFADEIVNVETTLREKFESFRPREGFLENDGELHR
jgi:ERCC4-related helicase